MKTSRVLLLLWCLASLCPIFANGDPIVTLSSLMRSSNPTPNPIVDIQILKEELYIQPSKNTTVRVKYVLHNTSGKDYNNIDYGFPVDYAGAGTINAPLVPDDMTESMYTVGWHDFYIKKMAFWINGNALPYSMSEETSETKSTLKNLADGANDINRQTPDDERIDDKFIYSRRWFYTQFSIKAGETCVLEVEYTLQNSLAVPLYSVNSFIQSGSAEFYYDMSPAQHWGDGTAKELSIDVDFSKATHIDSSIYKTYDVNPATGLSFNKVGNKMTYSAKNFNFKNSAPLTFKYFVDTTATYQELLNYRIDASAYTITASDELQAYPLSNLSDSNLSTAWVTKAVSGAKKQLKIKFDQPTLVGAIIVVGGYHKSVDTYRNNAQPKTIAIDVDDDDYPRLFYTISKDFEKQINSYKGISDENLLNYSLIYTPPVYTKYYNTPITEITLEIEDIYPGAKFDDICISEIVLLNPYYAMRI